MNDITAFQSVRLNILKSFLKLCYPQIQLEHRAIEYTTILQHRL